MAGAMPVIDTEYKDLSDEPVPRQQLPRLSYRLALVGCAVPACLLNSGLVFGFSALYPSLVRHGAFHDACLPGGGDNNTTGFGGGEDNTTDVDSDLLQECDAQGLKLTKMFTLATSALNLAALPTGIIFDRFGPKATATGAAVLIVIGCVLFANGGSGWWEEAYNAGFLLLAVSGPAIFIASINFPNLMPGREGLVTAALVGAFDCSSGVFVVLNRFTHGGADFTGVLTAYAAVPAITAVVAALLWPNKPFDSFAARVEDNDDGPGPSISRRSTCVMAGCSALSQLQTVEFAMLALGVSTYMVSVNFFIASVNAQVNDESLSQTFGMILPAGGIFWIPVIGAITDNLLNHQSWLVLWASTVVFTSLVLTHLSVQSATIATVAFAVISFCRPLLYTLAAASTGRIFGFENFGTIYGTLFSVSGVANCLVQVLTKFAQAYGFVQTNVVLLIFQVAAVVMPLTLWYRRRTRLVKFEVEEQTISVAYQANLRTPSRRASQIARIQADMPVPKADNTVPKTMVAVPYK